MGALVSGHEKMRPQGAPAFARRIWREQAGPDSARAFAPRPKRSAGFSDAGLHVPETVRQGWRSPGSPLQPALRQRLEPRFGDLGRVRVHTNVEAEAAAETAGASAFTWKDHVVFGGHRYQPGTPAGQALLAHELVHVAQQRGASTAEGEAQLSGHDHPLERNARAVLAGSAAPQAASQAMVQRQGVDEPPPVASAARPRTLASPVTLFPLPADLEALRRSLLPGVLAPAPTLPPLRLGERPSPRLVEDTARGLWLPGFQQQGFRQFVIDSFLRAQASADGSVRDQPASAAGGAVDFRDDLSKPKSGSGGADEKGPDVTHQILVPAYDPQNTVVSPRSQRVRGSGVGVVVDQAAAQWDASGKQFKWSGHYGPSGDVTLSLLTAPTIQVQTEGFPQPAAENNKGVPSNVQQASIAAGGSVATVQVGTDENPRFTANFLSATAGVQASGVAPRAGGPSVPQPTQFQFGLGASVEATVHTFCDGGRLGIGFSTGVQAGVTPGGTSALTFSPTGVTFTFHQGNPGKAGCR
jgi:hypothetical protein